MPGGNRRANVAPVRWTLTVALVLALPSSAGAQKCIARPGTAALDQYCETIPSGGGQRSTRPTGNSTLKETLPRDEVSRLQRHGDEGNAVLALPSGPAPPSSPSTAVSTGSHELSKTPPGEARAETDAPPAAPSANPVSATFSSLGLVGSLGWGLVALLAVVAALAAAAAWSSSRRPERSGAGPRGSPPA
jgi:hypothetical protein